jgi:site-specific recombinase XerD
VILLAVIENQHGVELENQEKEVYFNFMNSLKSPYTKESYSLNIKLYLKFCNLTKLSELLTIPEPQKQIIKYIISLREKGLSTNSMNTMLCAIYHLYEMNAVIRIRKARVIL